MYGAEEIKLPLTMTGESPACVAKFRELVASGQSIRMAEILACRQFPGLHSDEERMKELPPLEQTAGKCYADKIKAEAAAAGIVVSDNSRYNPTMADYRGGGDPNAWIHAGDGISTYKQRLKESGGRSEDLGVAGDDSMVAERYTKKKAAFDKRYEERSARRREMRDRIQKSGRLAEAADKEAKAEAK